MLCEHKLKLFVTNRIHVGSNSIRVPDPQLAVERAGEDELGVGREGDKGPGGGPCVSPKPCTAPASSATKREDAAKTMRICDRGQVCAKGGRRARLTRGVVVVDEALEALACGRGSSAPAADGGSGVPQMRRRPVAVSQMRHRPSKLQRARSESGTGTRGGKRIPARNYQGPVPVELHSGHWV